MNGDGRVDIVGSWPSGVYYRDSISGSWVFMSTAADLITVGDMDVDGKDDLIGVWSSGSTGLWVKYSSTAVWKRLSKPLPADIASGDMNGYGKADVVGTWSSGTYYWDTEGNTWVYVSTQSDHVAAGDLDGDGTDDLIGTWSQPAYKGLWVKYSSTMSWKKITKDLPTDIDAGRVRKGAWDLASEGFGNYEGPIGGYALGPQGVWDYVDFSERGPGADAFECVQEKNLSPQETYFLDSIPGPGEPGFVCVDQLNPVPREEIKGRELKEKK
jgi:hypothetical protein